MFRPIWKRSTFKLNFSKQMVNEALLVREEINVGWVFLGNPTFKMIMPFIIGRINVELS
jgi:hypothetical protein